MPLLDATLNIGADAMKAAMSHASIHTAIPDSTGSSPSTAPRQPIIWDATTGGDMVCSTPIPFTGGAPGGPALVIGLWSAPSAGVFRGWLELDGDLTFNSEGELTVDSISIPGTAT